MPKITWDAVGERFYETGTDRGVLYLRDDTGAYPKGVPWNGLTGVSESPSGAEPTALWADNIKYLNMMSAEEFAATIEAFYSPKEFDACDGTAEIAPGVTIGQQTRKTFGFSYRTVLGNDIASNDYGYKIHLVYGCLASPSEKSYATINDSPDANTLSWEVSTTPVPAGDGFKHTSIIVIDSTVTEPEKLSALEDILYGGTAAEARLPLPTEIATLMAAG